MTRHLPDVEALLAGFLADCANGSRVPDNVAGSLPFRRIRKLGGTAVHGRFLDKPLIQITSLAGTREAASDLAEVARDALFDAWRHQTRTANGGIHKVLEVASPFEVNTGTEPDGVFRFDATYQVWTRP